MAWVSALGDGAVTGNEYRVHVLIDSAAEDINARCLGLGDNGVRGFYHRILFPCGDHHGVSGE